MTNNIKAVLHDEDVMMVLVVFWIMQEGEDPNKILRKLDDVIKC